MSQLYPFSKNNPAPNIKHIDQITEYGFISNGKDILDLGLGSSGCFPLGFKRQDIIDKVTEQLKEQPFCQSDFATTNNAVNELSEKLNAMSGGYDVMYSMSGSDAIEGAIKLAQMYNPKRKTILGFKDSYHGSTFMSASVSGSTYLTDTFGRYQHCATISDLTEINESTLAVIIETCSWQAGLLDKGLEFWKELRNRCTYYGALLIVDDIAFCNWKTNTPFGWQVTGITPDIFCIGKGITGGYFPLSATLMNSKVSSVVREKVLLHGFAYSFPMSGIHSALAFIDVMHKEEIYLEYNRVIATAKDVANKFVADGLIKEYRNFGVCFNFILNHPIDELWEKEQLFYKHGLHIGVWNNYKEGILIMLPLNATQSYFDSLTSKLSNCLLELNQRN